MIVRLQVSTHMWAHVLPETVQTQTEEDATKILIHSVMMRFQNIVRKWLQDAQTRLSSIMSILAT